MDITIARRVGDTEQLYGSVTGGDIADFLKAKGFEIDRRKLILPEPIKAIGEHNVPLKLHRDVTVPLKVKVVAKGRRPQRQALVDDRRPARPHAPACSVRTRWLWTLAPRRPISRCRTRTASP